MSTGKERDAETGLDYFGARYFSAPMGRFTSPDKPFVDQLVEDPQSWNLYAYVRNIPLALIDDDGTLEALALASRSPNSVKNPARAESNNTCVFCGSAGRRRSAPDPRQWRTEGDEQGDGRQHAQRAGGHPKHNRAHQLIRQWLMLYRLRRRKDRID